MASAEDHLIPLETDSRPTKQALRMTAGRCSATLDESTGGDVGGHSPCFLSLTHLNILDLGNKGRPYGCLRRATTSGAVDY